MYHDHHITIIEGSRSNNVVSSNSSSSLVIHVYNYSNVVRKQTKNVLLYIYIFTTYLISSWQQKAVSVEPSCWSEVQLL